MGLPAGMTAATGMDAIAHCLETFMSPAFNPPADGIALDGLWRAWQHIERATRHPDDRVARMNMMSASMQGALAFQKGLGCVHSLSHSLGGLNPRLHHGTLNAIFLPAVIDFNKESVSMREENKLDRIAAAMGLGQGSDVGPALNSMTKRLGLRPASRNWMSLARCSRTSSRARSRITATRPTLGSHPRMTIAPCWKRPCNASCLRVNRRLASALTSDTVIAFRHDPTARVLVNTFIR